LNRPGGLSKQCGVRDAVLDTIPPRYVSVDGEVTTQTPIRLSIAVEALLLMVPQEFQDRDGDLP
jgi:hypothetical protein